jgi:hypothetical protein
VVIGPPDPEKRPSEKSSSSGLERHFATVVDRRSKPKKLNPLVVVAISVSRLPLPRRMASSKSHRPGRPG